MNVWERLDAARRKDVRRVVGLMSGTSADGIDAVVAEIRGHGAATRARTLAFLTVPYEPDVRRTVLSLGDGTATDVCLWNVRLGHLFADAALAAIAKAGLRAEDVDLVGSHGQTIVHLPRDRMRASVGDVARGGGAATLQIAEPSVIAEATGAPVVADFRQRDVAAAGEGAPLVPWVDWLTMRPAEGARIVQNLGGVANVTLVTQAPEDVVAFDTGPANGPIDAAAALVTEGRAAYDEDGRLAAAGHADLALVEELIGGWPWLDLKPPKSASRETWGESFVATFADRHPALRGADLVATMTELVARSIADAYSRHLGPRAAEAREVVVSGGGVRNPTLMRRLADLLAPRTVVSSAALGIDPDAREALAFAVLANETLHGGAGNLPGVTGASRGVVLGKIVP